MTAPDRMWFLLGIKPGEKHLMAFAVGWSSECTELDTEHEPRAIAVLKKRVLKYKPNEYRLHASRLTIYGNGSIKDPRVEEDRMRWRREFMRFLARSGLTLVEQNETFQEFVEMLLRLNRESQEERYKERGIRPLSQSLWGKSVTAARK